MTTRVIKFSLGALGMVLVGVGALYGLRFFSPEYQQEQAAMQRIKEIEDQYKKDMYGGDTPEETIQLFIDALKKEDIDLAAKYFVIDSQQKRYNDLIQLKGENKLGSVIDRLNQLQLTKQNDTQAYFILVGQDKTIISQVIVRKEPKNNRWKITEL